MATTTHRARRKVRASIVKPSVVTPEWYRVNVVEKRQALRRAIRACAAALQAFRVTGIDSYDRERHTFSAGPLARWRARKAGDLLSLRRQAENELAALEELYPTPEFWQPRKSTAADKRIAKQYDAKCTPGNFRFWRERGPEDYASKKDRRIQATTGKWSHIQVGHTVAHARQVAIWRDEWAAEWDQKNPDRPQDNPWRN